MADLFGFRFTRIKDSLCRLNKTARLMSLVEVSLDKYLTQMVENEQNKTSFVGIEISHNNQSVIVQ